LGTPLAFINAEELTAFRTALASTILFSKRSRVHTVAIFGAGKQAYWHIRLALILRGEDIHQVNIINRTFSSAEPLMNRIYKSDEWEELRHSNPKLKFSVISAEFGEYTRILKEHVRRADAIFMCTPSLSPLFPAEHLTNSEGRKKGRYISLIGSYKPNMVELHPDVLRQAVAAEHRSHHHKHAERGGVIIVDSLESCLREAGEVIQAGLNSDQLVEIGELLMVKKAAMREVEMGGEGEKGLQSWLQGGNVIYKSVGLGIMDVCVGENLVVLARERGYGTTIEEF
jgi:ornithine cyclodeaminase/alanine dehydrogenase-like protein (mu-crystallin family)